MKNMDVTDRIKNLAKGMVWKCKKILYFVSNTEQATLFLEQMELSETQLRLVNDRELSMFCNFLVVRDKVYSVRRIEDADFLWADEIVLMVGNNITKKFLEKYDGHYVKEKIRIYDSPYECLQKLYLNGENVEVKILDKLELDVKHDILENDIPFIEESLIGKVNKGQEDSYFTYSMGRRNLVRGIYFDEKEIENTKSYKQFNKNTIVIVFGKKIEENDFTEESLMVYRAIYGSSKVFFVEDVMNFVMEDGVDYIFVSAGLRLISPYFVKYFKSMREKTMNPNMIGLVSPGRVYCPEDIKIIWGNKKAFTLWRDNSTKFADEKYWYQYVINECIVADEEMFNRMDFCNILMCCKDKESRIGYTEWLINRMVG